MRQYRLKKLRCVHSIHFVANGSRLLAVGGPTVREIGRAVWLDLSTGRNIGYIGRFAACAAVDPGGTRYAVAGSVEYAPPINGVEWTALDDAVEWRTFRPKGQQKPPGFGAVAGLAFDPTGTRFAVSHTSARKPVFSVVEVETGKEVTRREVDPPWTMDALCRVVAFSSDGTRLLGTGGVDHTRRVFFFDLTTGGRSWPCFEPPGAGTRCARFLPDGRCLVANGCHVYELALDGAPSQFTHVVHPKQVNAIALTPGGRRFLTACRDGSIRTWGASTGEPGPAFDWHIGAITALAFAPDGLTCAAAGASGKVVVWDVDL
jgi:WD40 repeat protein